MTSLNALLKQIRAVGEAHTQVNTYAEGQRYDYSATSAIVYPCLWVVPTGVTPDLVGHKMDYRFTLLVMDIEDSSGSNQIDILNDSALILTDVVAQLQQTSNDFDEWTVSSVGSFEPFVDAQLDTVSGHSCELVLTTNYSGDTCTSILEGYNPPINAIITDNRQFLVWH